MKKNEFLSLFFLSFLMSNIYAQKISFNISVGITAGIGKMVSVEGYTPYLTNYTEPDYAHDISIKYYFNTKTALEVGIISYTRYGGLKFEVLPTNTDPSHTTAISLIDSGTNYSIPTFRFYRALSGGRNSKFRLWWMGGVHLERVQDHFQAIGGFAELYLVEYTVKEGLYPMLTTGISADFRLRNGNLGLKLVGGLGFVYHEFDRYNAVSKNETYDAWSKHKGDYIGLLATWEYGLPRRYKKDKNRKSKKKKRK